MNAELRPLRWMGDSRKRLIEFPLKVRRTVGYALDFAQRGGKHPDAKPLKGIDTGVFEIISNYRVTLIEQFMLLNLANIFMCYMFFKKNQKAALKHLNMKLI